MLTLEPGMRWPKAVAYATLSAVLGGRGIHRSVGGESIKFPVRWFRYYPKDYEPETFAFLRASVRPGTTALDIGAHIGLFSVVLARLVGPAGQVYSFEPTSYTRRILAETIRLNACSQVTVRPEAVTATSGEMPFYDTGIPGCNANSLVPAASPKDVTVVPTISVDQFVAERGLRTGCIKIDAEGAELGVMRGASRTIREQRPAVSLAVHPAAIERAGGSLAELWEEIAACGLVPRYKGQRIDRPAFVEQTSLFDVQLSPE